MSREERRWVFCLACGLAILTTLPYLIGYAVQGQEWRYSGLLLASEDGYSYLAKMRLGSEGNWLFRTPYTIYPQNGFLGFFPYLLLGKLAGGDGRFVQLGVLFQLFRIGGVFAEAYAVYAFIAMFSASLAGRRWGTLLAMVGGGLGFLSLFGLNGLWQGVMHMPMEFYSPETFGFLGLLALPHLEWARAFLLLGLVFLLRGKSNWDGLWAGISWFGVGVMQPLTVVSAWCVGGAYLAAWGLWLAWRREKNWLVWQASFKQMVIAGLVSSPWVLYNFLAFQLDPFLKRWQQQNLIPSPPPGDYFLGYAILLPFVLWGLLAWRKQMTHQQWMPIAWIAIFPVLAYAPYNLQRRLPEGVWVVLSLLAIVGWENIPTRWRRAGMVWICLAFLTSLIFYIGAAMGVSKAQSPLFLPIAEAQAMYFLNQHAPANAVVLARYDTSTVLPAMAAVRVPIGHGPESLGLKKIRPRIDSFFNGTMDETQRRALVQEFDAEYIFWGPLEKTNSAWDPTSETWLVQVYSQAGYRIFQVKGMP